MQWPNGWEQIVLDEQQALEAELKREVAPGHPLYSVGVNALARRNDCDDVLFGLNGSASVATVHLSMVKQTRSGRRRRFSAASKSGRSSSYETRFARWQQAGRNAAGAGVPVGWA